MIWISCVCFGGYALRISSVDISKFATSSCFARPNCCHCVSASHISHWFRIYIVRRHNFGDIYTLKTYHHPSCYILVSFLPAVPMDRPTGSLNCLVRIPVGWERNFSCYNGSVSWPVAHVRARKLVPFPALCTIVGCVDVTCVWSPPPNSTSGSHILSRLTRTL